MSDILCSKCGAVIVLVPALTKFIGAKVVRLAKCGACGHEQARIMSAVAAVDQRRSHTNDPRTGGPF